MPDIIERLATCSRQLLEAGAEIARLQAKLAAVEKILLGNIGSDNARIAKALLTVQQQTDR